MRILFTLIPLAVFVAVARAEDPARISGRDWAERSAALTRYLAAAKPGNPTFPKDAMPYYAARLELGVEREATLAALHLMLDATLKETRQDPFNLHALMHGCFLHKEKLPEELRRKIWLYAAGWDYTKPTGISLNYDLMRDGGGYLAAQEWPDLKDKAGHDAVVIRKLCGDRLLRQYTETCARNASEYDAPVYLGTDLAPARMVAEYAADPTLRSAARLTLAFMLVHTGAHWLDGYHISAAGRGKYWGSLNLGPDAAAPTNGMAYLFFGGHRPASLAGAPQAYWLAHPGKALPLDWLPAWQAALPDARTVVSAHPWAGHRIWVTKLAWFNGTYGLASQREDGTPSDSYLYKECRRTMLKWRSDQPASSFTLLQENRRRPKENIRNNFAYGENPYARVLQHEGTLVGLHDVPADYGFHVLRAPFTTTGAILARVETNGWIACHGGSVLFGFRSVLPGNWGKPDTRERLDLFECPQPRNGWVLETSPVTPFAGGGTAAELRRFAAALATRTRLGGDVTRAPPRLTFTNLLGRELDLTWNPGGKPYAGECRVDGKVIDYTQAPLLRAPGVEQAPGGPMVLKLPDRRTLTLDFKAWTETLLP